MSTTKEQKMDLTAFVKASYYSGKYKDVRASWARVTGMIETEDITRYFNSRLTRDQLDTARAVILRYMESYQSGFRHNLAAVSPTQAVVMLEWRTPPNGGELAWRIRGPAGYGWDWSGTIGVNSGCIIYLTRPKNEEVHISISFEDEKSHLGGCDRLTIPRMVEIPVFLPVDCNVSCIEGTAALLEGSRRFATHIAGGSAKVRITPVWPGNAEYYVVLGQAAVTWYQVDTSKNRHSEPGDEGWLRVVEGDKETVRLPWAKGDQIYSHWLTSGTQRFPEGSSAFTKKPFVEAYLYDGWDDTSTTLTIEGGVRFYRKAGACFAPSKAWDLPPQESRYRD
ncbi:MAG: hypothetical protein FJ290_10120 [Planctomycetes bacterium]|nr:hypothetical protein [Planctomycetota bacterium]